MFFSHTAGSLGIGHVTEGRAVAFVASASTDLPTSPPYDFNFCVLLLSNSENREHLKNFRNVDCVLANHNKVQDMWANLETTN